MYAVWFSNCRRKWHYVIAMVLVIFAVSPIARSAETRPSVPRNKVYPLKHISGEKAKSILLELNIGLEINQLPKSPQVLVMTANSSADLRKATTLLGIIDSENPYKVTAALSSADAVAAIQIDQIAKKLPGFVVGTFTDPPIKDSGTKILIDKHNNELIVAAPANLIDLVINTIKQLSQPAIPEKPIEPEVDEQPEPAPAEEKIEEQKPPVKEKRSSDDFLNEQLLEALTAAEKTATSEPNTPPQPNEQESQADEDVEPDEEPEAETKAEAVTEIEDEAENGDDALMKALQALAAKDSQQERGDAQETEAEAKGMDENGDDALMKALQALAAKEAQPEPEPVKPKKPIRPAKPVRTISETTEPAAVEDVELEVTITLPTKVEIIKLIELVGKQLGLNYIYDPKIISGDVMLKIHDGIIKESEVYDLLESVLKFKGFVMTRRGNLVTIVRETDALKIDPVIRSAGEDSPEGNIIVATVFKLEHIDTASAANLLKNMNLGIKVEQIKETNTMIVTGYAYRMPRIERLLKMVDMPGEPRKFLFRQLEYTIAANLVQKVQTLAEQLGTVSISIGAKAAPRTTPTARRPTTPRTPIRPTTPPAAAKGKKNVYLDVDERTNRILMIGTQAELDTVNSLIDSLDVQQQDLRQIRQYEIENVGAEDVESTLSQLGIIGKTTSRGGISGRPTSPTQSKSVAGRPTTNISSQSSADQGLEDQPQVVILEATNSLLVNATTEQHNQIALIIAYVDQSLDETANPYVIYSLEYQPPEDLAETLKKVIGEAAKAMTSKDPKVQTQTKAGNEDIVIVPDVKSSSVIVYASRKDQEQIAQLIEVLDKRRPQVLIDVTLVEISKDDSFEYDLNLVSSFPNMDHTTGLVDSIASSSASAIDDLLAAATDRKRLLETSSVGGTGKAFYADNHIQALLTLMETNNYGRVLAQPKILVNDNEAGSINSDKTTYLARTSTTAPTGDNQFVSESTTIDEFTSGINLEITPHINEGDLLRLEINLIRSQQESAGSGVTVPPDRTENNITTIVTVPDKSTIILGGIQQLSQSKDGSKVPLLGDLPLIGGLFRSIDTSDNQTKLYIFVKANILRPEGVEGGLQELVDESNLYRQAYEDAEADWQKKESWPGVKPKPVKPEKFLDVR